MFFFFFGCQGLVTIGPRCILTAFLKQHPYKLQFVRMLFDIIRIIVFLPAIWLISNKLTETLKLIRLRKNPKP